MFTKFAEQSCVGRCLLEVKLAMVISRSDCLVVVVSFSAAVGMIGWIVSGVEPPT